MRTIVLIVKCFDEKLLSINKSAVFDAYMKHKKSAPACSFAAGALLISSRNFPGVAPSY